MLGLLLGAAIAGVGCGDDQPPAPTMGSVGVALTLPSGADVVQVDYQLLDRTGGLVVAGAIPVPDPKAVVSVIIGDVPAATGYVIKLSANTSQSGLTCFGEATFDVVAAETTSVDVTLLCRAPQNEGSVVVSGHFDLCPRLTSFTAGPLAVPIGQPVAVAATATDADPGDVLTFSWTATSGTFDTPAAAKATYTCAAPGPASLTVTVSDGACTDVASIDVTCVSLCGNGRLDPGEDCDPPNGATCGPDCRNVATCGNRVVEPGEQCDPPRPGAYYSVPQILACSATCQSTLCGNGVLDPGEECEPPEAGWTPGHGSPIYCGGYCTSRNACTDCVAACAAQGKSCDAFTGATRDACRAAAYCLHRSTCVPDFILGYPFCSACSSLVTALAGSASDPSTPLGAAAAMGTCMKQTCLRGPYSPC